MFNYHEHGELAAGISWQTCCSFSFIVNLLQCNLFIKDIKHTRTHTYYCIYTEAHEHMYMHAPSTDAKAAAAAVLVI